MRSLVAATLTLLAGCQLYFGGGDDECLVDYAADIAPALELRDPATGDCRGFGANYPCDDRCGPCPQADMAEPPDWGACHSQCEALAESACITVAGCRAAYVNNPSTDEGPHFWGCWATAPSGPVRGGGCANLDAYECSRHDDCSAHYENYQALTQPVSSFIQCTAEKQGGDLCAAVDCQPGYHCEEQCSNGGCGPVCVPDVSACAMIDCGPGYECVEVCTSDPNNPGCGVCNAECKPTNACETLQTETACTGRPDCVPVYIGEDCTCYPTGCDCNILTYDHCETK